MVASSEIHSNPDTLKGTINPEDPKNPISVRMRGDVGRAVDHFLRYCETSQQFQGVEPDVIAKAILYGLEHHGLTEESLVASIKAAQSKNPTQK